MPNNDQMIYRSLGKCGTKVSAFGLGGWTTFGGSVKDSQIIKETLHLAFERGINFFDIADVYAHGNSEIEMGKVLKNLPRHELVISSKVYFPMSKDINDRGLSRKHIFESLHKSLKRIGTDYLDIYFCHRFDSETPLLETIRAMHDLVSAGKIHYWGTSEWQADQIEACLKICDQYNFYRPQIEQPEFNLFNHHKIKNTLLPLVGKEGLGMVTWSPLASGLLTGKYAGSKIPKSSRLDQIDWLKERLLTLENLDKVDQLMAIARRLNLKPAQLALAWTVKQTGVSSVILGVTRTEQLEENLSALQLEMSPDLQKEIEAIFS